MAKFKTVFTCQQCGYESPKWMGKCPECSSWNSFVETVVESKPSSVFRGAAAGVPAKPQAFAEIKSIIKSRIPTGIPELDRVLGGGTDTGGILRSAQDDNNCGIVPGSMVLVTGEPGIGKSTLLIQLAAAIAGKSKREIASPPEVDRNDNSQSKVLYISGEESPQQIKLRGERLGIKGDGVWMLAETDVDVIVETVKEIIRHSGDESLRTPESKNKKQRQILDASDNNRTYQNDDHLHNQNDEKKISLIIVDSVQTLTTNDLTSAAGSVGQVKECTARLLKIAKSFDIPIFLVSHVTKEGVLAGPKVLEHLVDTVLFLEGEKYASARLLRTTKNRFGATDEVGVFEMTDKGMIGVDNPSSLFLPDKSQSAPGSVVAVTMEGTRPLLLEVQALVVSTNLVMPRRVAQGVDYNRFQLVTAILSKHLGLPLGTYDIFVNVAGGIRVEEPALDVPIALAILSSFRNLPIAYGTAAFGELGLLGEVRTVNQAKNRTKEAKRLGFKNIVSPESVKTIRELTSLLKK